MLKNRKIARIAISMLIVALLMSLTAQAFAAGPDDNANGPARKIVVFAPGTSDAAKQEAIHGVGGKVIKHLSLINAVAVTLPDQAEQGLLHRPGVLRVDDDLTVEAYAKPAPAPTPEPTVAQSTPWGVARVGAPTAWNTTRGANVRVGIMDTGISTTHPDLHVAGGVSEVGYTNSYNDDNGHGSHVAGIVGALDNTEGVVGVAPQVSLYAIKVLDSNGSGYFSDIIDGLGWAITNKMAVVNMSFGARFGNDSLHQAIQAAYNAGITMVAAAGNSGPRKNSVGFPAQYAEVIAVSATDSGDKIANFSSRGPQVDLAAPGVSILSTYKGTGYATLSGTSMAAPHVTGVAALAIASGKVTDLNGDGKVNNVDVQAKLQNTTTDLGSAGLDTLYGWGLVNAPRAVAP